MKIGMMSCAHVHTEGYLRCLQQVEGVSIGGIYDEDVERGQRLAQKYSAPFFAEVQAFLAEKLDGVIICSENVKHRPFVELCAGQTDYILCEKPIATTVADAQAMIDVCIERGTKLQIAYPVRFSPPIQKLKQTLDEGKLGKLYSAKCTNQGSNPGGWFIEPALSGGSAVIDHTVHVIDLLRWFWDTEVVEVYAEVGEGLLYPELGIDDAGLLSFKLANDIYGTLDTSWSRPPSYAGGANVKIEIIGEKGAILVDAFSQNVAVSSNKVGQMKWQGWGSNADMGLIRDFVGMIREGREPFITGYDGLKSMEVALAAYESARVKRPIAIA